MTTRFRSALLVALALLLVLPQLALGHAERESQFPDYATGSVPDYRPFSEGTPRLVVCKPDSGTRIATISNATLRAFNEARLAECSFTHIQAAVDAVTVRGTNIYVLPGEYREEPSTSAPCTAGYDGGVVEYDLIVSCGEVLNLITIAGDDPVDPDMICDNALCDLQIEGTGPTRRDSLVIGGFDAEGDWRKHNGIKADRADGFVLANMSFELFRENAIYVHETNGYRLDRVEANFNDLYGILTFTSDKGVISNCETHHNGDSGVYPGSAADVNADSTVTGPLTRWAVEITGCNTHHNALGFSGTAGNSVWFHDNLVHHNGAGYVTDSFVGGHPGMPQDHAFLENNKIYSNNVNYYPNVQGPDAPCHQGKPVDRGYETGTVCPAFPVPVGTGVLIAGGNHNLIRNNEIYDNWRNGVMLLWIPGAIRGDMTFDAQYDTSNYNEYRDNAFGFHPAGVNQPNGLDVWWDDQGVGNCWQGNTSTTTSPTAAIVGISNNAVGVLPDCDSGGSIGSPLGTKTATIASCATFNRNESPQDGEFNDPPGCDWFDTPTEPAGRQAAPDEEVDGDLESGIDAQEAQGAVDDDTSDTAAAGGLAATGGGTALATIGLVAMAGAFLMRRRERHGSVS